MRRSILGRLAVFAGVLLLALPAWAEEGIRGRLVDVAWLGRNLAREDLLLIDGSPGKAFRAGHIRGAVNADVYAFGGQEVPVAAMQERIRSWGVSPGKRVVLYDAGGTYFATSLFFDLVHHGFPAADLFVLDGGLAQWKAAGGAVTAEPTPAPVPGTFAVGERREDVRVRLAEFLAGSGDPANHALVNALLPESHFGGQKFFDRAGHVPNAILAPAEDFFNADKTFRSPEEIRRRMEFLGVKPAQQVFTHCGGGIAASVPFFALRYLADYPRVRLYKESQLEWLRDDRGLPFWTYDAPYLIRDRQWVSGWGSPMIRAFGLARMSVIDVRPADAYRASHVPFSIAVPAEVFRRHLGEPARLAAALGEAGVKAGDEAVIVSAGGLNPESALAFVLLERLGQSRVSLLAGSVDDWAFAGLPVEKAKPDDKAPSGKALAYPLRLRPGVVAADGARPAGAFPRILVASGQAMPARVPEGKVVHVPFTELVKPDGSPKPAMEIWTALEKAGVPRYAELVTIADDPGEAAVNYVVLKLMGYPDVKTRL